MSAGTATAEAPRGPRRPGRPASDAPERILDAAYEVLKERGYAGLTIARVASAADQNKALIAYYFGSKQGLVAAVARRVSERLVAEVLGGLGEPRRGAELVRALTDGVWRVMDEDAGLQRVYFDLSSQAARDPEVAEIIAEMKEGYRAILRELLRGLGDPPAADDLDAAAVLLIAGIEGLALERLERGESPELARARELFVRSAGAAIGSG